MTRLSPPTVKASEPSLEVTRDGDRVPLREKLSLGVGALAAFFGFVGISILAYPVYNMMLGVSATAVGFALMIPRLWDAITDPVVGRWSDNCRSRWGRRRPFVVVGAVTMGLIFVAIWYVPAGWSNSAKLAYFIATQIAFFTAYTIFAVPFTALSYEMTPDYDERTRVMAFLAFFHKVGELLGGWMIPVAVTLGIALTVGLGGTATGDDQLNMAGVRAMAWIVGVGVMIVCGALPGLLVRERLVTVAAEQSKVSIISGIRGALRSLPFVILVAVIVLNTLSGVLASGIDQYLLVYFMHDGNAAVGLTQKGVLTTGYAVAGFAFIPIITWLAGRFGKKAALYVVYAMMLVGAVGKWFIFVPGREMVSVAGVPIDLILLIDPLLCGPMWVAVKIMLASMMADICDDDELRHGQRREGLFGAVFSWLEKMIVSAAYLGTGLALGVVGFEVARGAAQSEATFTGMRLFLAGAPGITAALAIVALIFYPIDAARAAETRRQLEERRSSQTPPSSQS